VIELIGSRLQPITGVLPPILAGTIIAAGLAIGAVLCFVSQETILGWLGL